MATVYKGDAAKIYKSTDGANTWVDITPGDATGYNFIDLDKKSDSTVYFLGRKNTAGVFSTKVWKTTNSGAAWTSASLGGAAAVASGVNIIYVAENASRLPYSYHIPYPSAGTHDLYLQPGVCGVDQSLRTLITDASGTISTTKQVVGYWGRGSGGDFDDWNYYLAVHEVSLDGASTNFGPVTLAAGNFASGASVSAANSGFFQIETVGNNMGVIVYERLLQYNAGDSETSGFPTQIIGSFAWSLWARPFLVSDTTITMGTNEGLLAIIDGASNTISWPFSVGEQHIARGANREAMFTYSIDAASAYCRMLGLDQSASLVVYDPYDFYTVPYPTAGSNGASIINGNRLAYLGNRWWAVTAGSPYGETTGKNRAATWLLEVSGVGQSIITHSVASHPGSPDITNISSDMRSVGPPSASMWMSIYFEDVSNIPTYAIGQKTAASKMNILDSGNINAHGWNARMSRVDDSRVVLSSNYGSALGVGDQQVYHHLFNVDNITGSLTHAATGGEGSAAYFFDAGGPIDTLGSSAIVSIFQDAGAEYEGQTNVSQPEFAGGGNNKGMGISVSGNQKNVYVTYSDDTNLAMSSLSATNLEGIRTTNIGFGTYAQVDTNTRIAYPRTPDTESDWVWAHGRMVGATAATSPIHITLSKDGGQTFSVEYENGFGEDFISELYQKRNTGTLAYVRNLKSTGTGAFYLNRTPRAAIPFHVGRNAMLIEGTYAVLGASTGTQKVYFAKSPFVRWYDVTRNYPNAASSNDGISTGIALV